jgi:hypothetical protein
VLSSTAAFDARRRFLRPDVARVSRRRFIIGPKSVGERKEAFFLTIFFPQKEYFHEKVASL